MSRRKGTKRQRWIRTFAERRKQERGKKSVPTTEGPQAEGGA